MDKLFQIGSFYFQVITRENLLIPENFLLFQSFEKVDPDFTYNFSFTESILPPNGRILAKRQDLTVYETPFGEGRLIGRKGEQNFYACYQEVSEHQAEVFVSFQNIVNLRFDTVFTSLFALERRMIERNSLILHCAYMEYQGKGILFSAPSEIGKSTQASLWEKYRGSRTINGDRALLRKIKGKWTACGWPVCGSSEICSLGDTPIYAIVMLKQGEKNQAVPLSPFQAFAQLYPQITINQWNREFVQKAISGIEDLIAQVPVWQLTCDISEEAVNCLENALFQTKAVRKN